MKEIIRRTWAEIDLDALRHNAKVLQARLDPGCELMAVVKADGYGHGGLQIARMLSDKEYVWGFAVATLDEAVYKKKRGIYKPVLALGCVFPDQRERLLEYKVRMTVYTAEMAKEANVARMWLTHYSPSLIRPEEYKKDVQAVFPQTYIAKDGWSEELLFEGEEDESG